jgi:serine/threonine protein phosphatase 1
MTKIIEATIKSHKFSNLGQASRIWTIAAIHGQLDRLTAIHKALFDKFRPGDRVVYTGNYLGGDGAQPLRTLDEILYFRRTLMAVPGVEDDDIVFLRGRQEELWSKILQLQFAPNACQVVEWIAQNAPEIDSILKGYGSSLDDLGRVAREGVMSLTRWSGVVKGNMRAQAGHEKFFTVLRRAAFTENSPSNDNTLLFVHAGLNPARGLTDQGDEFWWSTKNFNSMAPYAPFKSVVRGHDPDRGGIHIGESSVSLDGGCGRGGQLVCAHISGTGDILEIFAA